jgi:hypothetical protein
VAFEVLSFLVVDEHLLVFECAVAVVAPGLDLRLERGWRREQEDAMQCNAGRRKGEVGPRTISVFFFLRTMVANQRAP